MSTAIGLEHPVQPISLLLTASEAAALCGLGRSTWWRHLSSGKIPGPVRIGRSVRWRRDELLDWLAAGCPPRCKWEAMQKGRPGKK